MRQAPGLAFLPGGLPSPWAIPPEPGPRTKVGGGAATIHGWFSLDHSAQVWVGTAGGITKKKKKGHGPPFLQHLPHLSWTFLGM